MEEVNMMAPKKIIDTSFLALVVAYLSIAIYKGFSIQEFEFSVEWLNSLGSSMSEVPNQIISLGDNIGLALIMVPMMMFFLFLYEYFDYGN